MYSVFQKIKFLFLVQIFRLVISSTENDLVQFLISEKRQNSCKKRQKQFPNDKLTQITYHLSNISNTVSRKTAAWSLLAIEIWITEVLQKIKNIKLIYIIWFLVRNSLKIVN